ncbi:alkene reductase [Pseudomonas sp. S2_C03]
MTTSLFDPIQLGNLQLPHRIVMAPLTRSRASRPGNAPTDLNVEYYRQRASAALIITEASQISQQAQGYAWTPGIYTDEQVAGWARVADTVHGEGGRIFLQMWHVGRVSHPSFQPGGGLPVGPSAQPVPGKTYVEGAQGNGEWVDVPVPRELTKDEIAFVIDDYRVAARRAIDAGMDGVEIHAGNGYLLDQFINSNSNLRTDAYGGSIENRARFLIEVADAVVAEVGAHRVGVRLTPMGRFMGMGDATPEETFGYVVKALDARTLAYLHLVEPQIVGTVKDEEVDPAWDRIILALRAAWRGTLILAGGYDKQSAEKALANGRADLIAFGRSFIANPDLPLRLRLGAPLNLADGSTFFGGTQAGYTDYAKLG